MDPYMSVLFMLCISFPEAMLLAYFSIQFMGGKPRLVEIVLIGLIQMVVAYIVRILPIPVGLHTILMIVSLIILVYIISKLPPWDAVIGVAVSMVLEIVQEVCIFQLLIGITGLSKHNVIQDQYMRILFYIPIAALMLITILIFKKYDITFSRITGGRFLKEKQTSEYLFDSTILYKEYIPAVIFIFLPLLLLYVLNSAFISVSPKVTSKSHFATIY